MTEGEGHNGEEVLPKLAHGKQEIQTEAAASREQIDLVTASAILQAIVNTHESTITETTPLDRIGGYSTEQVREAIKIVVQSMLNEHSTETEDFGMGFRLEKDTPQGRLRLDTERKQRQIGLFLIEQGNEKDDGQLVLRNTHALVKPWHDDFGFADTRVGRQERLGKLEQGQTKDKLLDRIRFMHRGLRWMNANMLDWDNPNTIMPEELDKPSLPRLEMPTARPPAPGQPEKTE